MRDGACWGSTAWEQVVPAQPWGTQPWSRARAGQSHGATASLPLPEGEPNISLVLFQGRHPLGAQPRLVGALLLLVPTDDTSTTQGASVLCQEQLFPTSSAHHARNSCTGSGRRVSGGLRRWSLGRGRSRAALRTKPGGSRLRAPTMSLSGVPPHPQSQLSRLRGACRSPGPRAGPGSCSTAAHKLLQPLRAAPAWLRNAGARRACGRGGSRQHRQGLWNSVPCPTELGRAHPQAAFKGLVQERPCRHQLQPARIRPCTLPAVAPARRPLWHGSGPGCGHCRASGRQGGARRCCLPWQEHANPAGSRRRALCGSVQKQLCGFKWRQNLENTLSCTALQGPKGTGGFGSSGDEGSGGQQRAPPQRLRSLTACAAVRVRLGAWGRAHGATSLERKPQGTGARAGGELRAQGSRCAVSSRWR